MSERAKEMVERYCLELEKHEELWNADQCSQYLGFSRHYFMNKVSKRPDFPKTAKAGRRWVRNEVIAWATRKD